MNCCSVVSIDCWQNKPQTIFYCCGVVTDNHIDSSSVRRIRHGMVLHCFNKSIEVGEEVDDNETKICQPAMPFLQKIPEGLYVGRVIQIDGKTDLHCKGFYVNLETAGSKVSDVFFHFNPRFDRRVVVRNTRKNGTWGVEEIAAGKAFPIEPGRGFRLTFFVADGQILVAVNCKPYCSFAWRMALETVKYLAINGDVTINSIQYEYSLRYPLWPNPQKLQLIAPKSQQGPPTILRRSKFISPGTKIEICGRVKLLPQSFYINFQQGALVVPHPLIPLHINLRLCERGQSDQRVLLNSWINGSWGSEVHPSTCPFLPGLDFILTVIYLEDGFYISVNDEFWTCFPLRLPCAPWLDTVLVEGDVIITKLRATRVCFPFVKK